MKTILTDPGRILARVSQVTGVSPGELMSPDRTRRVSYARFLAMATYHERCPWASQQAIARLVGRTCHVTAIHGLRRAAQLRGSDPLFAAALHELAQADREEEAVMDALSPGAP